ncbi:hypothetical protein [Streptomyces sp. PR69]|uniref:hypothetical protein n=1 Tax=Streptomyces sp. PR69 TaxID=2984950 RepID=UPI0022656AE9|nr:hypothetical protein [Streptomyces sp. PR69]
MAKELAASGEPAETWTEEADAISLPRLDEIAALARPGNIGEAYSEREYAALAREQEVLWSAEGEEQGRPLRTQARGLDGAAAGVQILLVGQEEELRQAREDYLHAARVLSPHTRREPGGKLRYWVCWLILVLGDMAGVWASAVSWGDVPYIAFGQALASGVAAGCAGLVGLEIKYLRMARMRQRDANSLSDDERRYIRLFSGDTDKGLGLVGLVGVVSLGVVLLAASGVYVLRGITEGAAAGLTFGCLAAATAAGSFLLGFSAGDEVSDLVYAKERRARRAEARYQKLAASSAVKQRAEAEEAARSVQTESVLRGQAAAWRMEALNWRVQRNNPQVLGHGFPAEGHVVGRRDRQHFEHVNGDVR